jgi:hypothetical protein
MQRFTPQLQKVLTKPNGCSKGLGSIFVSVSGVFLAAAASYFQLVSVRGCT